MTFPISDTAGLEAGVYLDYEELTPNSGKVWGRTPSRFVEKFTADLAKWKRGAAG